MYGHHLTFYEIRELNDFDMILGEQGLRQMKAEVRLFDYSLKYQKKKILAVEPRINYTINNEKFKDQVEELMNRNNNTNGKLPLQPQYKQLSRPNRKTLYGQNNTHIPCPITTLSRKKLRNS